MANNMFSFSQTWCIWTLTCFSVWTAKSGMPPSCKNEYTRIYVFIYCKLLIYIYIFYQYVDMCKLLMYMISVNSCHSALYKLGAAAPTCTEKGICHIDSAGLPNCSRPNPFPCFECLFTSCWHVRMAYAWPIVHAAQSSNHAMPCVMPGAANTRAIEGV